MAARSSRSREGQPVSVCPHPIPKASTIAEQFVAHPLHLLHLCEQGTRFDVVRDGKSEAILIPVGADLNSTGNPE